MLHLTRCCLCVTMLAVTTAFAQTSTIQDQMGAVNAFTAEDDSRIDTNGQATRTPDDTHVAHDQSMTQRERVLTRAIKSLEKRLEEPAPQQRRSADLRCCGAGSSSLFSSDLIARVSTRSR